MPRDQAARALFTIAVAVSLASGARADDVRVDLSGYVNADLTTYTGGSLYPQNGGLISVDGIPFLLATIGPNQDTGIIQTSATSEQSFDIPINLFGVTAADALINSAWGLCGTNVGEIDFVGSSGTYVYTLTEGSNIRDHYNGSFCNVAPGITASANYGTDRLDLHSITLPAAFANETLESIDFVGYGLGELGSPFLAGLTVDPNPPMPAAPEPSTLFVISIGGAAMALFRRLQ